MLIKIAIVGTVLPQEFACTGVVPTAVLPLEEDGAPLEIVSAPRIVDWTTGIVVAAETTT